MTTASVTGPITIDKRAVCWLDVLIFTAFITISLAFWAIADHYVAEQTRDLKPIKEDFDYKWKVPALQARLAMAQDELKTLNGKLVGLKMDIARIAPTLSPPSKRPRVRLLSPQRAEYLQVLKAQVLIRAIEVQIPKEIDQLSTAAHELSHAKHAAELEFEKTLKSFRIANKIRVAKIVAAAWALLAIVTCTICHVLRSRFGHGSISHVLIPGVLVMLAALSYYLIK